MKGVKCGYIQGLTPFFSSSSLNSVWFAFALNSAVAGLSTCNVSNQVTEADNELQTGDPFPMTSSAGSSSFTNFANADLYAVEKEKYLGSLCAVTDSENLLPWYFWTIMLKNGNFDENLGLCESFATAKPAMKSNFFTTTRRTRSSEAAQESSLSSSLSGGFPCFGKGCMNPPLVYHNWSSSDTLINPQSSSSSLTGSFYGTYDLADAQQIDSNNLATNVSYFSVTWEKNATSGSWIFHHLLKASPNYPWLMLYLRADTTSGESGGYPWDTRGMIQQVQEIVSHGPCFLISFPTCTYSRARLSSSDKVSIVHELWRLQSFFRRVELLADKSRENFCFSFANKFLSVKHIM